MFCVPLHFRTPENTLNGVEVVFFRLAPFTITKHLDDQIREKHLNILKIKLISLHKFESNHKKIFLSRICVYQHKMNKIIMFKNIPN